MRNVSNQKILSHDSQFTYIADNIYIRMSCLRSRHNRLTIYPPSFLKAFSAILPDPRKDDIPAIFPSLNHYRLSPPNGLFIAAHEQAAIASTLKIYHKHTFLLNYSPLICFPPHQKYFEVLILDTVSISSLSILSYMHKKSEIPPLSH